MITVQLGDRLPTVATVQRLLNARRDTAILVDGAFGPITQNAVRDFQRMTHCSTVNGRVDNATWNRLNQGMNFTVHDVIDITDPELLLDLGVIERYNDHPIVFGGMSNAVEQMVNLVISRTPNGSLVLLRFDGHGNQGIQVIGVGRGWIDIFGTQRPHNERNIPDAQIELYRNTIRYSSVSGSQKNLRYVRDFLSRLRPCFSPYGSIEFHGCRIALGAEGRSFMQEVSDIVGVPATGSLISQDVGTVQRFMGTTFTGCPNGVSLKDWSGSLPELNVSLP